MATPKKSVLGRGLSALIPKSPLKEVSIREGEVGIDRGGSGIIARIPIESIRPNPFQPRTDFDHDSILELSNSIVEKGMIQPITVRRFADEYQLISGERRLRAAQQAGLSHVPAYVLEVQSDSEMLELALVENIQREELNPIDIAHAYQRLLEELHLTQEEIARKVGKDRTTVTNFLRLLKLPEKIRDGLRKGRLTMGHARAILSLDSEKEQMKMYERILAGGVSVRTVERTVRSTRRSAKAGKHAGHAASVHSVEEQLKRSLGTKVKVHHKGGRGEIVIEYYSMDDLERILELIIERRHR